MRNSEGLLSKALILFSRRGLFPDKSTGQENCIGYKLPREAADQDVYITWEFEPGFALNKPSDIIRIVEERATRLNQPLPVPPVDPSRLQSELNFDIYAYICGLNFMVSGVRELLAGCGWHKKQIVFERYD